jgi:hypothetical protein
VANKGWQSPADVIRSYQGVEKLVGRDPSTLLAIPRADDPDGMRAAFSKLGMPDDPAKYEFAKAEGVTPDEGYVGWARGAFHKAGLTAAQVKGLTAEHNAYVASVMEKQAKDYDLQIGAEKAELLNEWRGGHERMMNAAQTAAKELGFTPAMIDSMERTIGYKETMKFFAGLGSKLGEDNFVSGAGGGGFNGALTPAEAKNQWEAMKTDPTESKALFDMSHPGHQAAKIKQARLFKTMYPEA